MTNAIKMLLQMQSGFLQLESTLGTTTSVYIKFSNKRQIFKCDDKLIKQITQPTIQFSKFSF
jgi:hypothetical protein